MPAGLFAVKIDRSADRLPLGLCKEACLIEQGPCQCGSVRTVFRGYSGFKAPEIMQESRKIGQLFVKASFFAMRTAMRAVPKRCAEARMRSVGEVIPDRVSQTAASIISFRESWNSPDGVIRKSPFVIYRH